MLKFLVTGAAGQLGKDVVRELDSRGYEVTGSGTKKREVSERYVQMDITDAGSVMAVLDRLKPDIVIHCAAWMAVDAAEEPENYEKVWEVNGKGTANLASACQKIHAKMVYISTDYVFGGQGSRPWEPDCEEFSPLNRYGETKLQGEQAVKAELKEYFIVRIAWVFGKNGNNFVKTMLEQGKRRKELRVVCDQIGTPTYTADLAKFLANLSMTKRYGIYHVTNEGEYVSWYDFAKEIFAQAVKLGEKEYADVKVIPVTTAEYGISKAARPFNSRLDRKRICEEGFQPLPVWKNALERYLQEVLAERKG